jgi:hypothetical protein
MIARVTRQLRGHNFADREYFEFAEDYLFRVEAECVEVF